MNRNAVIVFDLIIKTRKLCYRKDVRAMHNLTIRTWFEARKSNCTILYRLLGCTGTTKAKTGVSVAIEAKPEVKIRRQPKKSKERVGDFL